MEERPKQNKDEKEEWGGGLKERKNIKNRKSTSGDTVNTGNQDREKEMPTRVEQKHKQQDRGTQ